VYQLTRLQNGRRSDKISRRVLGRRQLTPFENVGHDNLGKSIVLGRMDDDGGGGGERKREDALKVEQFISKIS
jgi:hypothetical protein